ncbi:MAG: hypothetical protein IKM39_01280, partial [Clostridia bacterium]|nr:hypothetical protein [Clostridia bacterium]
LLSPLVKHWHKKAVKRYPEIQECMETYYRAQGDIENCSEESLDYYSHPTADVLGKLFSYNMPTQSLSRILYTIGYNVGKWVYLIDALEDYQQDLKKNSFNPYRIRLGEKTTIDQVANFAVTQLNICMDEACMAFDLLPKGNFYPILHNILFLGLDHQVKEIVRKVKTNE